MNAESNTNKKPPNKRRQSRAYAMQAIFQWHFSDESIDVLLQEFIADHLREEKNIDLPYFRELVFGTLKQCDEIDATMTPFLDRDITALNPVELAVLRLAVFELKYRPEVPPAVVMNEAIEIAKGYGSADGYKFVNAVLNAMVRKINFKKK